MGVKWLFTIAGKGSKILVQLILTEDKSGYAYLP
jgi:hypothetical protein